MPPAEQKQQPVALLTDWNGTASAHISQPLLQSGFAVLINGTQDEVFRYPIFEPTAKVLALPFDITNEAAINAALASGIDYLGEIDVLVNNLNFWNDAALDDITDTMWTEVLHLGIKGTFNCCRVASKIMRAQKFGKIINIISTSAITGTYTQYAAGCAAIQSLTRSLARELAPHVRINSIATGLVDEPWIDEDGPEFRKMLTKDIPLGRLCKNEDIAEAVCYHACGADFMTGQMLVLDGGESMGG